MNGYPNEEFCRRVYSTRQILCEELYSRLCEFPKRKVEVKVDEYKNVRAS
jgi:hypothetical protein